MVQKKERQRTAKIESIHTEYARSLEQQADRKKAQKVRLYRRLSVLTVAAILVLSVLAHNFFDQRKMLTMKKQEHEELLIELKAMEEEQDSLKGQLVKLDDDEYIAKLARQEYFLSDKSEIIFSMPNKKEIKKKESGKKE